MAINNPVIADADIIQDTAVAIQEKDHGGKMEFPDMPSRIRALPTNLIPKTITENGVYNATDDNADGYDVVTVNVPEKNTLDEYFANTLEVVNIPSAKSLPSSFFNRYTALKSVNAPNLTNISSNCFAFCSNLETINITTTVMSLDDYAFYHCHKLILTALPNTIINFGRACFSECVRIPFLDMSEFNSIPVIGVNVFENTSFPFYFRDQQQLDEWAAATNWSTYANRFQIKPSEVL